MALPGSENLLWLEPLLLERLRAVAPDGVPVFAAADLAGVEERQQFVPAIHLLYGGSTPGSQVQGEALIEQTWIVVAADRSSADVPAGTEARARAGRVAAAALGALLGWVPEKGTKPLDLIAAPPASYQNGFTYLPLAFRARFNVKGVS